MDSRGIIGNSSVAIRECSYLGVPAVNVGTRQSGREHGRNVIDVDHNRDAILEAGRRQIAIERYEPDGLYGDGQAGKRIADLLASIDIDVVKQLTY